MDQKSLFKNSYADEFFERIQNQTEVFNDDPISQVLKGNLSGQSLLEIGCGTGARVNYLKDKHGLGRCVGIEPSKKAVETAKKSFNNAEFYIGTADDLSEIKGNFDIVIFGFCLYLCDRKDLFKIANEADSILKEGGVLVIYDFYTPIPFKNNYHNSSNIFSYKQDYSEIFDAMPWYQVEKKIISNLTGNYQSFGMYDETFMVSSIRKLNYLDAYIDNPYKD